MSNRFTRAPVAFSASNASNASSTSSTSSMQTLPTFRLIRTFQPQSVHVAPEPRLVPGMPGYYEKQGRDVGSSVSNQAWIAMRRGKGLNV
jgi:hypothetical protein